MKKNIKSISSINELAFLLGVQKVVIIECITSPMYEEFFIPKRRGGRRRILAPDGMLKQVQRRLNKQFQKIYSELRPPSVFGFRKMDKGERPNIIGNAAVHCGKKYVFTIDLQDFFESITSERVREMFKSEPFSFNHELATALALMCCYKGTLPSGAPTSPVISNFVLNGLDESLNLLVSSKEISYTRYADDLTFSSNEKIINGDMDIQIMKLISEAGFRINGKKVREVRNSFRQVVSGLVVNDKVNVNRHYYKKLRAIVHQVSKEGIEKACARHYDISKPSFDDFEQFKKKIKGMGEFVGVVKGRNDNLYKNTKFIIRD